MIAPVPHVLRKPITHKYLQATWDFIRGMEQQHEFTINSSSPLINGLTAVVRRTEGGYKYDFPAMNHVPEGRAYYQDKNYGLLDKFLLKSNSEIWEIPGGVYSSSILLMTGASTGLIGQINNAFDDQTPIFHRLVLRQSLHYGTLARHIESDRVQVGSVMRGGGLVNVYINEVMYTLYDFDIEEPTTEKNQTYYFIDSNIPITYADFEKAIEAIIYASAFITGELPRDEMYIIQAADPFFYATTGARYRRTEKSVDSRMEVVAPLTMRTLKIGETGTGFITQAVLSTLASRAYNDVRMLRALKIVLESGNYPLEIRGATYSVALETVKEIVLEVYEDKVKPFREKSHAKAIIRQLKTIVEADEDIFYNDKRTILSKLENLNTPANSAGFADCFRQLGIKLNERDLKVLNNRNDFLHGRIPFENESKGEQNHELQHIIFRYHFLLSALVLKFSGYSGYIKNNATFYNAIVRPGEKKDEPLFRQI
jgi:hypothetical protein